MSNLLTHHYTVPANLRALRREFEEQGYVCLSELLQHAAFATYAAEVMLLKRLSVARDFVMPGVNTVRRLSTVGGTTIKTQSRPLNALYSHPEIMGLVNQVVGREVFSCQHEEEFMVANYLLQRGDTHGWHLDDPDFALVLFFESPPPSAGGELEYVPLTDHLTEQISAGEELDNVIADARGRGLIFNRHHRAGDGYLLHASRILHAVTSLRSSDHHRSVLNLAYQASQQILYGGSASLLYGQAA